MTEVKYPQITQNLSRRRPGGGGLRRFRFEGEARRGVEEVGSYRSYPLAQTILTGARCHFVLLRSFQCLGEVHQSFSATYDLWPYPEPLKEICVIRLRQAYGATGSV
jgi:hypothetical protein